MSARDTPDITGKESSNSRNRTGQDELGLIVRIRYSRIQNTTNTRDPTLG